MSNCTVCARNFVDEDANVVFDALEEFDAPLRSYNCCPSPAEAEADAERGYVFNYVLWVERTLGITRDLTALADLYNC